VPGEPDRPYEGVYAGFDSPVMRRVRAQASAEDIGQHSWVTAEQLDAVIELARRRSVSRVMYLAESHGR
jgi:hypothetical protein